MKFKVGDRVKVTVKTDYKSYRIILSEGEEGIIKVIDPSYSESYRIESCDEEMASCWCQENEIELVSRKPEPPVNEVNVTEFKIGEEVAYIYDPATRLKIIDLDFDNANGYCYKVKKEDDTWFLCSEDMLERRESEVNKMKFKVGDKVVTNIDYDFNVPLGTTGIVVQIDEEAEFYPYQIKLDSGRLRWYSGNALDHFSEGSEEAENLYDFNNMTDDVLDKLIRKTTDDDLDKLIRKAYEALMIRRKKNLMRNSIR